MKNIIFIAMLSLFLFGCSQDKPKVAEQPTEKKTATDGQREPETVAAHTLDKEKDKEVAQPTQDGATKKEDATSSKSGEKTKWSRGGTAIDVSNQTKAIAAAEEKLKAKPDDAMLKKNLAQAYTKRGVSLTSAQQYAAAIGDFRKALKYEADNKIAKDWVEQITSIYKGMNRDAPKKGEEPEPLEFKEAKS